MASNFYVSQVASLRLFCKGLSPSLILSLSPLWVFFHSSPTLIRSLPNGLVLLIASLRRRSREKKEGQCETSVRFISVSSDPDTVGIGLCVCVRELIDEEQLFMECQAALHIPTLMFFWMSVCVCWLQGKPCVRRWSSYPRLVVDCWPCTDNRD